MEKTSIASKNSFSSTVQVESLLTPAKEAHSELTDRLDTFDDYMRFLLSHTLEDVKIPCEWNLNRIRYQTEAVVKMIKTLEEKSRHDPFLEQKFDEVEWFTDKLNYIKQESDTAKLSLEEFKLKAAALQKENNELRLKLRSARQETIRKSYKVQTKNPLSRRIPTKSVPRTTRISLTSQSPLLSPIEQSVCENEKQSIQHMKHELTALKVQTRAFKKEQVEERDKFRSLDGFFDQCCDSYFDSIKTGKKNSTEYRLLFQILNKKHQPTQKAKPGKVESSIWKESLDSLARADADLAKESEFRKIKFEWDRFKLIENDHVFGVINARPSLMDDLKRAVCPSFKKKNPPANEIIKHRRYQSSLVIY